MIDLKPPEGWSWSFLLSIAGGLVISVLTADQQTLPVAMGRVVVGLLAAFIFTNPTVHLLGLDPAIFQNPIAALWAISGYVVMRLINKLRWPIIIDFFRGLRGR